MSVRTIAIDPGTQCPGVSIWTGRSRIAEVFTLPREVRAPETAAALVATVTGPFTREDDVVVEWPVSYPNKTAMHEDVEKLKAFIDALPWPPPQHAARKRQRVGRCTKLMPTQWKGAVPKNIHHQRVIRALLRENTLIDTRVVSEDWWSSLTADERDAVALGAFHFGITGRGGT